MGSRLRAHPDKLFEVFAEVGRSQQEGEEPFILQKYPPDYNEQDVLNNIPKFAFPCETNTSQVDQFTFVLTDLESLYRFGYCRHGTGAQTCLCIVSHLPWFEVFYKMLNFLAEIINRSENNDLLPFLKAAYEHSIPGPEEPVTIVAAQDMFNFTAPDPSHLPSIPASRNLTEYYNAVDPSNMMKIFASMLHERRIIITSKKLSRVTACIHASESLLYPMHWQHLYIPVLPAHLVDYVTAPMPYLIGVHTSIMEKVTRNRMEIGDAVIVDADKNEVQTEYDDLEALPEDVSSHLKRQLKTQKVQTSMMEAGDAISKAFLSALVRLIGGYRDALKFHGEEPITFDRDAFVVSRSSQSMQAFLENMLQLQIFQQFINGRLDLLNKGEGFHDLFEQESIKYADSLNTQSKYKEWLSKQKRKLKAGGKDIISDVKEKAAPMMNTAVQSMKHQGKKMMSKVKEINENKMSSRKVTGGVVHSRHRPTTILGSQQPASRPPRPPPPASSSTLRPRTVQIDRAKVYNSLTGEDELGSHDDSSLRLSYHRVDVGLMSDADIQNIMRSASAETLPQQQLLDSQSASDGDVSSTPSSEALSPSDENLTEIPYVDIGSSSHGPAPFAPTSSSEEDMAKPKPPPLPTKETKSADRLIAGDRLIGGDRLISSKTPSSHPIPPPRPARKRAEARAAGASPQPSPQLARPKPPIPRKRSSLERVEVAQGQEAPPLAPAAQQRSPETMLIQFESSESDVDGVDQFDPLVGGKGHGVVRRGSEEVGNSSPETSHSLTRNKSSRNSLARKAAFRRAPNDMPVRSSYRDDISPEKETGSADLLGDIFDPLSTATSLKNPQEKIASQSSAAQDRGTAEKMASGSLMHDWTLDQLAGGGGGGGAGFSRVPSGGTLTCPTPAAVQPVSPVPGSIGSNPLYRPPPQRLSTSMGVGVPQSNPLYQPARPPKPAPNPKPSKADPFGDLVSLNLGGSSTTASPAKPPAAVNANSSPAQFQSRGPPVSQTLPRGFGGRVNTQFSPASSSRSSSPANLTQPQPVPRQRRWETFD